MIEEGASPGLGIPQVNCSECSGTGQYAILEEEDFTQMAECENCGGTGMEPRLTDLVENPAKPCYTVINTNHDGRK